MSSRALSRAARLFALAFALTAFSAVLIDSAPSVLPDETETENELEIEAAKVCDVHRAAPRLVVERVGVVRDVVHTIRESEVLTGRNVTFRIDRPPPA